SSNRTRPTDARWGSHQTPYAPTFVRIIKGMVATDTTTSRTRYANPSALDSREFVFVPMTPASLATTRMGRYVSGMAAADNTTTNSVTLMGSTVVMAAEAAITMAINTDRWNRG